MSAFVAHPRCTRYKLEIHPVSSEHRNAPRTHTFTHTSLHLEAFSEASPPTRMYLTGNQ